LCSQVPHELNVPSRTAASEAVTRLVSAGIALIGGDHLNAALLSLCQLFDVAPLSALHCD
jgi:hypothetical protein